MPTALVTGSPARAADVAEALAAQGFEVLTTGAPSTRGTIDCYVQLPATYRRDTGFADEPTEDGLLLHTRDLLAHQMLARFDDAARLASQLTPSATVVLVSEAPEADGRSPELALLRSLISVLAATVTTGTARARLRGMLFADDPKPEVVAAAVRRPAEPPPWRTYAEVDGHLDYADWRTSILALSESVAG